MDEKEWIDKAKKIFEAIKFNIDHPSKNRDIIGGLELGLIDDLLNENRSINFAKMETKQIPIMKDEKGRILYMKVHKDPSKILVVNTFSRSKIAQKILMNSVGFRYNAPCNAGIRHNT